MVSESTVVRNLDDALGNNTNLTTQPKVAQFDLDTVPVLYPEPLCLLLN